MGAVESSLPTDTARALEAHDRESGGRSEWEVDEPLFSACFGRVAVMKAEQRQVQPRHSEVK